MMPQPRRKKWAEAEERTLIEKYGEMICDGSLCKMKTREKKYRPIALYVNSVHHARDPVTYPWQWTWKDVSTKVQNMRHQYALVKQKIKRQECSVRGSAEEEYDWMEGITHWSNFLRYKEVFGDVPLALVASGGVARGSECTGGFEGGDHELDILQFDPMVPVGEADFVVENGVVDVGFNYDAGYSGGGNKSMVSAKEGFVCEDIEPSPSDLRKKKKGLKVSERKTWAFVANQLNHLRKLEIHLEQRDAEREREMQRRENHQIEMEKEHQKKLEGMEKEREIRKNTREKVRRQLLEEWQTIERENEEREKGRREEEIKHEIELEERLKRRRLEWKKRMNEMVSQHREEMSQLQARVLHDQQTIANQFLGLVSQWAGHPSGISDHAAASSHYLPQNLDHVHGDAREDGNNQEDQFIVDG